MHNQHLAPTGGTSVNDSAFVLSCICGDNLEDTYRVLYNPQGYELCEITVGGSYPCESHMDLVIFLPARYQADLEADHYVQWVADSCGATAVRLSTGWACMDCGDTDIDPASHCCYGD